MSARDLAKMVQTEMEMLPAREQIRFLNIVSTMSPTKSLEPKAEKKVVWEDRTARLKEIFGDKVLEKNIVLEAREEEDY